MGITKSDYDFKIESKNKNSKVTVIGIYKKMKSKVLVKCNKCGEEFYMCPDSILRGSGHKSCSSKEIGRTLAKKQNVFIDEAKCKNPLFDVISEYINNKEKIKIKCVKCGFEKEVTAINFLRQTYKCPICSDGTSFPNRLFSSCLIESKIEFEAEKKFDWSGLLRYDFYIPSINTIVEMNGAQHYNRPFLKSLEKQQNIDLYKKELCEKNGIKNYVVINASLSDFDFVFDNILESSVGYLFYNADKNNIKNRCFLSSSKINSFVACYKNGITRNVDLQKELGVCKETITSYKKIALSNNLI